MRYPLFKITLLLLLCINSSCNLIHSPEEYFDKTALNTNMLSRFGGSYFHTYQKYIKGGAGTGSFNTCEKYLKNYSIAFAERDLKKVEGLYPNTEAKPMIEASIDLYNYVLQSYKTDHLEIAQMIDRKAPEKTINEAIKALDEKSYTGFSEKYDKLWILAKTYAKNNGIEVKEMPF
ncbi:hypothetical protein SAMN05421820_103239 [Pedobacter steynii]|uniref:Lipoprotein n=1 Tax=Pedobacter steynii TaxID=430522 RepID=A0A1G9RG63_9SPHI|nr:hypothetical protein [Pedobacter steynii]NQX37764.1 hypothetical protein [Pedobacter steynii]SDM22329.1 hypothetical protein SAMN05421820_103239 [Pedobacter steynii]